MKMLQLVLDETLLELSGPYDGEVELTLRTPDCDASVRCDLRTLTAFIQQARLSMED